MSVTLIPEIKRTLWLVSFWFLNIPIKMTLIDVETENSFNLILNRLSKRKENVMNEARSSTIPGWHIAIFSVVAVWLNIINN